MNTSNITNYKPKDFAELLGVSVKTLQRWDREGTLKANRTPTDRRYYTYDQYLQFKGINTENDDRQVVIYARVSTRDQKDDLQDQVSFLRQFCNARGMIVDQCIEDYGSGLNYNRKKWNQLLDEVMDQKIKTIIVTHKDRFIRFGYDWFERFCMKFNTTIMIVNNEELSPQEELVQDIVSILHVFSCRLYGLRKYKKQIEKDEDIAKELQDGNKSDWVGIHQHMGGLVFLLFRPGSNSCNDQCRRMTVSNVILQNYHRAFPSLFRADMRLHVCIVDVPSEISPIVR